MSSSEGNESDLPYDTTNEDVNYHLPYDPTNEDVNYHLEYLQMVVEGLHRAYSIQSRQAIDLRRPRRAPHPRGREPVQQPEAQPAAEPTHLDQPGPSSAPQFVQLPASSEPPVVPSRAAQSPMAGVLPQPPMAAPVQSPDGSAALVTPDRSPEYYELQPLRRPVRPVPFQSAAVVGRQSPTPQVDDQLPAPQAVQPPAPADIAAPYVPRYHQLTKIPPTASKNTPRRKCRQHRVDGGPGPAGRKDTRYECLRCDGQPALCLGECYDRYHSRMGMAQHVIVSPPIAQRTRGARARARGRDRGHQPAQLESDVDMDDPQPRSVPSTAPTTPAAPPPSVCSSSSDLSGSQLRVTRKRQRDPDTSSLPPKKRFTSKPAARDAEGNIIVTHSDVSSFSSSSSDDE